MSRWYLERFGQSQNRTGDTRIFSPLLYRLSYLAKEVYDNSRSEGFSATLFFC